MMNLVDSLRASRQIAPVKLMEFIFSYRHCKDALFCFVEGEDSKFYGSRVQRCCDYFNIQFINSGGKKEVLRLFRIISSIIQYNDAHILYFIDRDFDPPVGRQEIYETPCYSIENLYTSKTVFSRIIKSEFGLVEIDEDYEKCIELFQARQSEFHQSILLLNAWIACQRAITNNGIPSRLDLANFNVKKYLDISLDKVISKYTMQDIERIFPEAVKISEIDLESKIMELEQVDKQKAFRGKFEIVFFKLFLDLLKTDRCSKDPKFFSSRYKVKLALTGTNLISELSGYAENPECLGIYVISRLVEYLRQFPQYNGPASGLVIAR